MKEPSAGQTLQLQLGIKTAPMLKPEEKVFVLCLQACLPQWQRGQQSQVSQRNSVPSGQDGVSTVEQLTFVAEMNTSSFTFMHCCNTHLSPGDCQTSPT